MVEQTIIEKRGTMGSLIALMFVPVLATGVRAEDKRTQYPFGLKDSFVEIDLAYLDHPFSQDQLEPGYRVGEVTLPHPGARLAFGHRLNRSFSVQIVYARPVRWVRYEDVTGPSGEPSGHSVLTNLAGVTVRSTVPLAGPFSLYAEGGLGIVTRTGFRIESRDAVKEANYATVLVGTGLTYRLSEKWDLRAGADYSPPRDRIRQPYTFVASGGAAFTMRPRSAHRVAADARASAIFPKNLVQVGHSTNEPGTGVNRLFSSTIPVFWGGSAVAMRGIHLRYQRNVYHTARLFSFDVGASVGNWWSDEKGENFWTFSVYPQFRFTPVRTKPADVSLYYSLAGPTCISRHPIDGRDTAGWFTFQDLMGIGVFFGKNREYHVDAGIGHYSDGNLSPHNSGVKLPLTVSMGITF